MPLPKHLEEAVQNLEDAALRIEQARAAPPSAEALRIWLDALTDYATALSLVHRFTNESVHEKLHLLARRLHEESALGQHPRA